MAGRWSGAGRIMWAMHRSGAPTPTRVPTVRPRLYWLDPRRPSLDPMRHLSNGGVEVDDPMAVGDSASATVTVAKISISSAALLHRCTAAAGDCDGLLFGRASRLPAPPPSLSNYDDLAIATPAPALSISVSGHCSLSLPSSLSDPLGRFEPPYPTSASAPVGFFSSRCLTALRPLHSRDRRRPLPLQIPCLASSRLVPASLIVINVGPGFRDQYHSFTTEPPLPWLPPPQPLSPAASEHAHATIGEQKAVDATVDGFGVERLQGVVGSTAGQVAEMDDILRWDAQEAGEAC